MMHQQEPWAIILAGGNGSRLRLLTERLFGNDTPKQFCALYGEQTLLGHTRSRISSTVSPQRTIFSVVRQHERFYEAELADAAPSKIIVQPANKGTTAAIVYSIVHSLSRVARFDEDSIVALFPTDHYYADEESFSAAVSLAFDTCRGNLERLILLGSEAKYPEVEYGWIEPGEGFPYFSRDLYRVTRFWEKPSPSIARILQAQGCLWNTFVVIGRAKTFLDVLNFAVPDVVEAFEAVGRCDGLEMQERMLNRLYATLPEGDFSGQVLRVCTEWLSVLKLGDVGWSDLGTPERVGEAIRVERRNRAEVHAL
jgi:mannose-1-phosphate guanylyltransferase